MSTNPSPTTINVQLAHVLFVAMGLFFSVIGTTWFLAEKLSKIETNIEWMKQVQAKETSGHPTLHELGNSLGQLATFEVRTHKHMSNTLTDYNQNFESLTDFLKQNESNHWSSER